MKKLQSQFVVGLAQVMILVVILSDQWVVAVFLLKSSVSAWFVINFDRGGTKIEPNRNLYRWRQKQIE